VKNKYLKKFIYNLRPLVIGISLLQLALLDPYFDSMDEGNRLYNDNKYTDADEAYNRALEYMPSKKEKPYVNFNRGTAQFKAGNYEGAVDYFKKALESSDADLQKRAFYNLGNSYYKKGDIKSALEHYMNALKIDPEYQKPKQNIEAILKEQNQQDKQDQQNDQKKENSDQENQNDQKPDESEQKGDESSDRDKGEKNKRDMDGHKKGDHIEKKLSKEQIDNILNHFKQRPVQKGKGDGRAGRALEKNW